MKKKLFFGVAMLVICSPLFASIPEDEFYIRAKVLLIFVIVIILVIRKILKILDNK